MKKCNVTFLALAILLILFIQAGSQHFYGGGQQIPLYIDSSKMALKFDESINPNQMATLLSQIGRIDSTILDDHAVENFIICALEESQGIAHFLDSVLAINGVFLTEPYYVNELDSAFVVGTRFCVAFDETVSSSQIDSINAVFGVVIDHEVEGMPNVFVLRNTDSSGYRLLDLANAYYDLSVTRYSHPEFGIWIQKSAYRLFDYYNSYQAHTKKVIGEFNTASVWDFAGLTGDTITVAVIDDGVESHEDLPGSRVLAGVDYADQDNDPSPGSGQGHGMGCAGIIASSHTTDSVTGQSTATGMISLNPITKVKPVKIFHDDGTATGVSASDLAAAITYAYASGADLLSNSWTYFGPCPFGPEFDVLNEAIENATVLGRGGLGCPVIFSAGNYAQSFNGVAYPACLPTVLSVGALELDDTRWYYSSNGSALDLSAPSGDVNFLGDVWSLDPMTTDGYNNQVTWNGFQTITWSCGPSGNDADYDCKFGGTSAAAPVVAGVASLILAKDPTLTATEVYEILEYSAVTDLDWGSITPPNTQYGYGRVDAFRAILSLSHGDVLNDGEIDISDMVKLNTYLFKNGPPPFPDVRLADVNCDGSIDVADMTYLVNFAFKYGPLPPSPCFEF